MTTLITGGTLVSATGRTSRRRAHRRRDGSPRCSARARPLLGHDLAAQRRPVIDATGKYVIPGGIDAHTHMELPFGGTNASDTFETGTRAAAWGGTTTIIDFAVQRTGERVQDGLAAWHDKARRQLRDRLRLPPDRRRRRRRLAQGDGAASSPRASPATSCSWPTRASSTRDDAQILRAMQKAGRPRAAHDDARGERPGDRRARRAARRAGQDRPVLPRHRARLAARGGGHAPGDHAGRPHRRARCTWCT